MAKEVWDKEEECNGWNDWNGGMTKMTRIIRLTGMLNSKLKHILIFSGLLLLVSCAQTPVYNSNWQNIPLQFDGSDETWLGQFYYDQDARMLYGLSNDEENIYVRLKVIDQATQRKIIIRGLTFWMDSIGKSKKQITIGCPLPRESGELQKMMENDKKAKDRSINNFNLLNETFSNGQAGMEIMGFDGKQNVIVINNKNNNGINVMMNINDQQELIWEAIIPLKMVFSIPSEYKNGGRSFSFGFESGAFDAPPMQNKSGAGGRKPGGGGGRGGGQRGGNINPQGNPEMQAMMNPSKVKIKKVNLTFENN